MKILLGALALLGTTTTFAYELNEIDFLVTSRGVVDQDFKVIDQKQLNTLLWESNNKAIKRFPHKLENITFHYGWLGLDGALFKVSMDGVNNTTQLAGTVPKGANLDDYVAKHVLCGMAKQAPELYFSDYFKITLSGNMKLDFYDKNMKLFKSIKTNIRNCPK